MKKKVTFEHEGQCLKGYLSKRDGVCCFAYKHHPNARQEEWGVSLPDLPSTLTELVRDSILQPDQTASLFIRGTVDLATNAVRAANLHKDAPVSLLQTLGADHPDRDVWLQSFY